MGRLLLVTAPQQLSPEPVAGEVLQLGVGVLDGLLGYLPGGEGPDQFVFALEDDDGLPLGYEGRNYDAHSRIFADTVSH